VLSLLCLVAAALAQDSEPRRWTHLPVGTNIAGVSYLYTTGDIHVDPVLRIEDAQVSMHTIVAGYNRYFALADLTARVDLQIPIQFGRWNGLLNGVPTSISREGLADPRLRFSVSFLGAPALEGEAFQNYIASHEDRTVVGAALALRVPLGQYDSDKLINLGENRFNVEPQLGVTHTSGPWSGELTGSAFFFTSNDDFFGGNLLRQDPLYAIQGHVVRTLDAGFWVSADASYGRGGETRINGQSRDDLRSNLLYGVTAGFSVAPSHSFRIGYLRRETLSNVGLDAHNVLLTWSMRF
jgi:hypothetical protein